MTNVLDSVDSGPAGVWRLVTKTVERRTMLIGLIVLGLIASVTIPVRDSIGTANIALAMAIVVVTVGARAGLWPGTTLAVVAGLTFALLHTVPHGLPRVENGQDVATAALLVVSGVLAGWIHDRTERLRTKLQDTGFGLQRLHRVAEAASALGADPDGVVDVVTREIADELELSSCRRIPEPLGDRVELQHNGLVEGVAFDAAPHAIGAVVADGVGIDLRDGSHLELIGHAGARIELDQLRRAIMLADYAAAVLAAPTDRQS
ncbi:MAG: DUF4118 domain-containing protein [Ilumatobacter sp.]|uniref:DUF4118 domain-containing protein n=1 Tax=Ilumatobacter sp. TaxID=1967498 RepID=UPI003C750341